MEYADRVRGAVRAGAIADALGTVVADQTLDQIQHHFGAAGLQGFGHLRAVQPTAFVGRNNRLPFSSHTQMSLYSMDALIELIDWANQGIGADDAATLWLAYLRWYTSQDHPMPENLQMIIPDRFIDEQPGMRIQRNPSSAVLDALGTGEMGYQKRPAQPYAQDAAALLRSLPFGLVPHVPVKTMLQIAHKATVLTHGHENSIAATLLLTSGVRSVCEFDVPVALAFSYDYLLPAFELLSENNEVRAAVTHSQSLALVHREAGQVLAGAALTTEFGQGRSAAEVLSLALYLAITAGDVPSEQSFIKAVLRGINHSGASAAVGSLTAQLIAVTGGLTVVPSVWQSEMEQPSVINELLIQWLATMA